MAFALRFDGINDYCAIATAVNESSTEWRVEWRARPVNGNSTTNRIIAKLSGSTDYIRVQNTATAESLVLEINNTVYQITGGTKVTDTGDFYDYKIVADGVNLEYFVDGLSKGTVAGSPVFEDMEVIGRGGSSYFEGDLEYFKYFDTSSGDVLTFNWDATASSHAAGTPVLDELVSGNDATGVNMPTDGSAWIDLGGGGISIDINTGSLSLTGNNLDLLKSSALIPGTGQLNLTGGNLTLTKHSNLSLDSGELSFTGQGISLLKSSSLTPDSGTISLIGNDVTLTYVPIGDISIDIETGALSLVGEELDLSLDKVTNLDTGQLNLTGNDLSLLTGKSIDLSQGVLSLSGDSLELIKSSILNLDSGSIQLTGQSLALVYSGLIVVEVDNFSLSYTNDTIGINYTSDSISFDYTINNIKINYQ